MKRYVYFLTLIFLINLLSACSISSTSKNSSIHVIELSHATYRTTSGVQIDSNSISAQDGKWLLLSVDNMGSSPVLVFSENDKENKVSIDSGNTGALSKEIGSIPKNYGFKVVSADPGSEIYVSYTLTQSTSQPST